MVTQEQEYIAKQVLDCAFEVHSNLGLGLLENAYKKCLSYELQQKGLFVEEEKSIPLIYKGMDMSCGYRIDILVERNKLIIETKTVSEFTDIHLAQILNYMRLANISLGFLLNFNAKSLKNGIKRVVF
jgi:GxxExxY protein